MAQMARPDPVHRNGHAVSLKLDHVSMTAGGRLAGRIAGLDQGRANAGTAMSLLKVADAGLDEIDAKLARMKELAAQAASVKLTSTDPTPADTSAVERAILNEEFAQLSAEIDAIADTTTFNDLQILNGVSGSGTFSAAFNVGGDSQAEDVITVSIEAATIANLASGLAAADLLSVSGARPRRVCGA
jgi:flagellin